MTVAVHETAKDGLPDMEKLVGRVGVIWDGNVVSGWPITGDAAVRTRARHGLDASDGDLWEGDSDVANGKVMLGVTHWLEFPRPVWELVKP